VTEPDTAGAHPKPHRRPARVAFGIALAIVVGAAVGIATMPLARVAGAVGPGRVSLVARWDRDGGTALVVPPLGRVLVATHPTPMRVQARIERVDLDAAQRLAAAPSESALERQLRVDMRPLVRRLVERTALVTVVAGFVAGMVVFQRRWRYVLVAVAAAPLAVGALALWTWRDFDVDRFQQPTYEGELRRAPEVLAAVQRDIGSFGAVRDRVRTLSSEMQQLFALSTRTPAGSDAGEVRIVHVSDIHSNPLGLEIADQLAREFDVAAVVDTGDLTSFGLPVEGQLRRLVRRFSVPYYLVPGNHDSKTNQRALARAPNLTVVDGKVVRIKGVTVLGVGDVAFTADNKIDHDELDARRRRAAPRVAALVNADHPDVLAVASLTLAKDAAGDVPLAISGDVHRRTSHEEAGTLMLTVGSTGATGLGSFTVDTSHPYEAEILRFRDGKLTAVDYVSLTGVDGNFTVDRRVYGPAADGSTPPSTTTTSATSR
jgi:predicted phosphodiesterase